MSATCHLRDHRILIENDVDQPSTSVFGAFISHALLAHKGTAVRKANADILHRDKANRGSPDRVFILHLRADDLSAWSAAFKAELQGHAVIASTKRVTAVPAGWPEDRTHPCEWTPEEFANPPPRLAQWLQQLRTISIDDIDWELLRRDNAEPLFAFRLLCEAWTQVHIKKCPELNGITIHAPRSFADWLKPFGKDAADVVRLFGGEEIQRKAQVVLDAAQQNDNDALAKAVAAFLRSGLANT